MNEDRPKFQGDWKCSGCSGAITALPFQTKNSEILTCKECYLKGKGNKKPQGQMFEGNWSCNKCSAEITKLPFEPRSTNNLTCKDCYLKDK